MMDTLQLKLFLSLAKTLNFTKTANEFYVTQPTVSNYIKSLENGMGVSCGRLREDSLFDYKFVGLSHNTLRGAAGGAVLIAELLTKEGYITH